MSDVWFVRTATGEARMTLDELDAAFEAGTISEQTQVREENALQWTTLGALLGGEPAPPPDQHSASVRPVAVDLDDLDETQLKPKKTGVYVGIAAGVLALAGIAFAVTQFGGAPAAVEKAAAAGGNAAAIVQPQAAPEPDPQAKTGLTEEQKKALAEKDKDLAAKQAAKSDALREKREHQQTLSRPGQKSGPVFQKGGSQYDPLNQGL
jgi:hypothetical protein